MTRLTVVGSVNEDVTLFTDVLPAPGQTVLASSLRRDPGGKGGNQAAAAARLGAECRLIAAVGEDDAGNRMLADLRDAGVDVGAVQRVAVPTGEAHIVVDATGENAIVVAAGANAEVTLPGTLDGAVLAQLECPPAVVQQAASMTDGFFALNASPVVPLPAALAERCDLVVVNETEYAAMPELRGARLVVVTLGARGAIALERSREVARVAAVPTRVVSSVGAGDAFCAAAVLGIVEGASVLDALRAACLVGAAAVASPTARPLLRPLGEYLR